MKTIEQLKQENSLEDFVGFKKVKELRNNLNTIPAVPGVYVVLRASEAAPEFLEKGTGGFFKGKDPNESIPELESQWLEDESMMYIGKSVNLNDRIRALLRFGAGKKAGHWGGRLLWQLADAEDLIIAWKYVIGLDPRKVEMKMLQDYQQSHEGNWPYANLKD